LFVLGKKVLTRHSLVTPRRMTTVYTREDVAKHASSASNWVTIDDKVYDLTRFASFHPGGKAFIDRVAGQDATEKFYAFHRQDILKGLAAKYLIGVVSDPPSKRHANVVLAPGELSQVPYAEPSAFQGLPSPFYDESHFRFRAALRRFFDEEVMPDAVSLDARGVHPSKDLWRKLGSRGILASRVQSGPWLQDVVDNCGVVLPGGIKPAEFDAFHELIAHEESSGRLGVPGYADGLGAGFVIGLPPVLQFGTSEVSKRVGREVLTGVKRICLAISGPEAGSDVANVECCAEKTKDGKHYVVNGVKKWITNGVFADYFVTAVRTGPPGSGVKGLSLLLVERSEGLETKPIKTSYSASAGTAYVTYEDVLVPVTNLLGKEGDGFRLIMHNFNHERWYIVAGANRASRLVVEECFKWATQRLVFGKPLIEQPVIRQKLAKMVSQVEGVQTWLEAVTYQMQHMSHQEQAKKLAGPIALLKLFSTRVANDVSDESCQILGGRAITVTGMGQVVERFQRSAKFAAILGGSEEIMAELGIRQAMRAMPNARL
jgi:alkylation response protein AidB-like acyl-CoA dehydrogenase